MNFSNVHFPRTLLLGFALTFSSLPGLASPFLPQITVQPWQPLAPGIRHTSATATNPLWQIRLIEVDLSSRQADLEVMVTTTTANQTLSTMASNNPGVIAAINGGYFSGSSSVSHVRAHGQTLAQNIGTRPPRATFGLTHHGSGTNTLDLRINRLDNSGSPTTPSNDATWNRILDAIGGGPNLLTNSQFDITTATEGFDAASGVQPDTRQPRTALGIRSNERIVYLMTVDGRQPLWSEGMTVTEVAMFLRDLGCDAALNYDGGGSTTAWVNGSVINRPSNTLNAQRAINSAWGVVSRVVVDDTDTGEVTMTPSPWNTSANAGFYNSGSRIRAAGSAGDITFRPHLARPGRYRVEAWWVAASNRATNAPFIIQHGLGTTTVTRNQTTNGSSWQFLGEYEFFEGNPGSVSLSALHADGFISADAVRWTYVAPPIFVPVTLSEFLLD
jgi:hypothetical protein